MNSAVDSTVTLDDELTSLTSKRRRSSNIIPNEIDIDETPYKRVRSSSSTNTSTYDTNNIQLVFTSLNDIVQSHRTLVREYVDLQMCDRPDLSLDEQRFIQAEEDLIDKVEKNLHDSNHVSLTPPSRNGKRQRYQSMNATNQSFDRVKNETHILKRIDELKSDGKWTNQRLAKCLEPNKRKTHWDYLLDEMRWLAEDFALEKRWKQAMAKKLSLAVMKYFRDKHRTENQQQREEIKRLQRQAQYTCKEVMNFWKNIHRVAEYKETTRTQQLRKQQLDLHLNFIVDQTEKYSDWLVESLRMSSDHDMNIVADENDEEEINMNDETDDEETIEREEQEEQDEYACNEIQELKAGQDESLDTLLKRHYGIDLSNSSSEKENNYPQEDEEDDDDDLSGTSDEESITDENSSSTNDVATTDKQMDDLATTAQSFQPTGFTLNTTSVKIPVPFLLKHPLREYQHVGLDWLVSLYENKLNCILADEMGLGKTIQTIALLAHLACEKGVWGPHLIVVPTSVMLNWELEFKKWCPAFKILTYYGSIKERQLKRQGWTKVNAFHICITSYKLVLQDAKSFRRKKWKYLILDEAQNIKNFKSQRWQTLLNFHSQRRLLLTGTPLQNSLMELWSLMHFLMPHLFASHEEFREWFSNPLTDMIEQGQSESNDLLIKRLHKILRPFILRRLKNDVEKQIPNKQEHIIMCHLSKRQRELYEDFIQCQSTRETLQQGHYMSVINILMQLRKVCNHPDLFESRVIKSPFIFQKQLIQCEIPKLVADIHLKNPYLSLDSSPNDTFFSYRIQFSLQATKEMIMNSINRDHPQHYHRQRIQLTTDVIERYRNSSVWHQTNGITRNLRNQSGMQQNVLIDLNDQEFQADDIYSDICKQRQDERLSRFELLCQINADRCQSRPLYGCDVIAQCELAMHPCHRFNRTTFSGYTLCRRTHRSLTTTQDYMSTTEMLCRLVKSNREVLDECSDILDRFIMCTTHVLALPVDLSRANGIRLTTKTIQPKPLIEVLSSTDFDVLSSINQIKQNMFLQFPERRLIQYDCGKLQTLDILLSNLKRDKHRCLIFTQMTKMLDILEVFLNHHGYTYLRLDGSTPIVQRQILMERFNSDEKIFVFILSTRAGGIGVNLTGADTVIFYDSDWNPTMDAQAQDRCHRIGQTKDVHIYRLISKNTIEENILKKANQKRLLGDLTIDGGRFDVDYFKKSNIRELFDQSSTLEDIVRERNAYQEQFNSSRSITTTEDNETVAQMEEALAFVEDETDRQAADQVNREVTADLNEFNEEEMNEEQLIEKQQQQMNRVEEQLSTLDNQLRPIERYVLRCVEAYRHEYQITPIASNTYFDTEQIRRDWHLSRLKALKEHEEKQLEQEDDEMMYTYTRDNERKIWITEDGQAFEIWCGILMRYSADEDEDIYNDDELDFGYESEAMFIEPEEYIRYPLPKALADTTNMSKSDTNILVPRSLFDRSNLLLNTQSSSLSTNTLNKSKPTPNNNKLFPSNVPTPLTPQANVKARQLYVNNGTTTTPLPNASNSNVIVPASTSSRPVKLEEMLSKDNLQGLLEIDNSDWLISEDYKVLDTIQNIQQLPLSSMSFSSTSNANKPQSMLQNSSLSSSPLLPSTTPSSSSSAASSIVNNTTNALTQNWDFISDIVNRYSRVLRTPKQCKHRFEQVIGPREEGRVVYDLIKKKKHVIKGTVKMSDDNWQMLRTNQLFAHDNCQKLLQMYRQKFETITQFDQQLSPLVYLTKFKQIQTAQVAHHQMRGLKQSSLLQENNISFEVPLTPSDVSYQRSEREKELKQQQTTQSVAANVHPQQQQQPMPVTATNNIEAIKQQQQQIPPTNTPLTSTINPRVRPPSSNTPSTPVNSSPSTPLSLVPTQSPSNPPPIQRTVSSNIIVASNNHSNMTPTRSQSNILPTRTNIPTSTPLHSIPTATIVPGQRPAQVLPTNNSSMNETNTIPQKQVGTVQISANEYRHVRAVSQQQQQQQQQQTATHPSPTPTNLQVRAQNFQRNQAQTPVLTTLESRSQLPTSPKSQLQQQQQQPRPPPSTTPRSASINQSHVDYSMQSQTKPLTSSNSQSTLPVAVVRPMQHPSTSNTPPVSSSPTSPMNLPSLNVTLPSNKLTAAAAANVVNNPAQQLRTTTTFLPNQSQSTIQTQQTPQPIRQLFTNASNNTLQAQSTTNTQRLTEIAQRSPTNIQQILASRAPTVPSQVRNVRILKFTPGTNPTTGMADTTTTSSPQTPVQSTNITYNRTNSGSSSFTRSTINIDQDISPDLAAQLHRLKSFNVTNTDPNDPTQTPRAVLVPARTMPGSSSPSSLSVGSTSKIKSSSLIDQATLGFTTKPSQANIVLQLPSTITTGGDEQTATNSSGFTRQNLMQHLNLISSNINQRAQSPTMNSNTANAIAVNRVLQQYHIRTTASLNSSPSTTQLASGQTNSEQLSSSSPPPPPAPPSSSSSSSTT